MELPTIKVTCGTTQDLFKNFILKFCPTSLLEIPDVVLHVSKDLFTINFKVELDSLENTSSFNHVSQYYLQADCFIYLLSFQVS